MSASVFAVSVCGKIHTSRIINSTTKTVAVADSATVRRPRLKKESIIATIIPISAEYMLAVE